MKIDAERYEELLTAELQLTMLHNYIYKMAGEQAKRYARSEVLNKSDLSRLILDTDVVELITDCSVRAFMDKTYEAELELVKKEDTDE